MPEFNAIGRDARKYSVQLIVLAALLLAHYGLGKTHILPHALVVPLLAVPVAYFATVLGWKGAALAALAAAVTPGHCRAVGVLRVKEAATTALGADRLGASQDGEKGVYGAGGHHAGEQGAQYELPQTDTRRLALIHFRVWWWELA